jgi:hypothetical protein
MPSPKGALEIKEVTVSLKRYPDTKPSFPASCEVVRVCGVVTARLEAVLFHKSMYVTGSSYLQLATSNYFFVH